jgi:hypothetical protein
MVMTVLVIMVVLVIMIVIMLVTRLRGFRISLHEGFDHLAQGILVERQMTGEETRQPREDEGLEGQAQVLLVRAGFLAVALAAAQGIDEELVHIGEEVVGQRRVRVRLQQRAGMGEEARIEQLLQLTRVFVVAAHV